MGFRFRIRMDLATTCFLDVPEAEYVVSAPDSEIRVRFVPADGDQILLLNEARSLVLVGGEYGSEVGAAEAGRVWLSQLRRFLIATRTGVDLGDRAATSALTDYGLAALEAEHGVRFLNDVHGLSVYATDPQPRFVKGWTVGRRSAGRAAVDHAAQLASGATEPLPDRVRISYDLMAASMSTADEARLLLLMMALETLLEPPLRPEPTISLVDGLVARVRRSSIPADDKQSLLGAMEWLRRDSIGRVGRSYVRRLEPKLYSGMEPDRFFQHCYEIRSRLVHGNMPRPAREIVDPLASNLEVMVNDLLRSEIGLPPE